MCSATRSTRSTPVWRRTSSSSDVHSRRASSIMFSREQVREIQPVGDVARVERSDAAQELERLALRSFWQILKAS
jgi:hypothetical protein